MDELPPASEDIESVRAPQIKALQQALPLLGRLQDLVNGPFKKMIEDSDAERQAEAQELLADIERTFQDVSMSAEDFLSNPEFDLYGLPGPIDPETHQLDWRKIDPHWIDYQYEALAFCYPLELQFLLPAYMCYSLIHRDKNSNVHDFLVYNLYPSSTRRRAEKFVALSRDQSRVICRFLEFRLRNGQSCEIPEVAQALTFWTEDLNSFPRY